MHIYKLHIESEIVLYMLPDFFLTCDTIIVYYKEKCSSYMLVFTSK